MSLERPFLLRRIVLIVLIVLPQDLGQGEGGVEVVHCQVGAFHKPEAHLLQDPEGDPMGAGR